MPNTIKNRPLEPVIAELVSLGLNPQGPTVIAIRDMLTRVDKVLTDKGEVQSKANVTGRTEQLSTTLQNVNSTGKLTTADAIAADGVTFGRVNIGALTSGNVDMSKAGVTNKSTDNLTDGTGSPLSGGKRGFVALDSNNRLANSFRLNPVNTSAAPTSATILSNDGASTAVPASASTFQFGAGTVSYNSASYDPGSFGTTYAVFSDPTFAGGAASISFSSTPPNEVNGESNVLIGKIISINGSATTGGGYTKGGGRGIVN